MSAHCPRCLDRPRLEASQLKGVAVQICKGCHGILMTRGDMEAVVALAGRAAGRGRHDATSYFARLKDAAEFVGDTKSIACPSCHYNMYEVNSQGIVIDFCLNCQAVWFDHGELRSALDVARRQGSIDLIPSEPEKNATAGLICFMLDTVTTRGE